MLDLEPIFAALGAFVRADRSLDAFANADLNISQNGDQIRTLLNLQTTLQNLSSSASEAGRNAATQLGWSVDQTRAARKGLRSLCREWLIELSNDELRAASTIQDALAALADEMAEQSEDVSENTLTLVPPSPHDDNVGEAHVYASITEVASDGSSQESQLVQDANFVLAITRDSQEANLDKGDEYAFVSSSLGQRTPLQMIPQTIEASATRNLVADGAFGLWESSLPSEWVLSGATGILSEETGSTIFGDSALLIDGTGSVTLSQECQALPEGGAVVSLGVHAFITDISVGEVAIRLRLNSSPMDGEIVLDDSSSAGAWAHFHSFVALPRLLSTDLLEVEIETSVDFDGDVIINGVSLAETSDLGAGVRVVAIEAATEAVSDDRFLFATSSDDSAPFTTYLRDAFGAVLPSASSPSIDDALAE